MVLAIHQTRQDFCFFSLTDLAQTFFFSFLSRVAFDLLSDTLSPHFISFYVFIFTETPGSLFCLSLYVYSVGRGDGTEYCLMYSTPTTRTVIIYKRYNFLSKFCRSFVFVSFLSNLLRYYSAMQLL